MLELKMGQKNKKAMRYGEKPGIIHTPDGHTGMLRTTVACEQKYDLCVSNKETNNSDMGMCSRNLKCLSSLVNILF
jgi:hypothetical protein